MGSSGPSHVLPSGWYIEDPKDGILLGNLPVNALNEWDVAKLGKYVRNTVALKRTVLSNQSYVIFRLVQITISN